MLHAALDGDGKILSHLACFDGLDAHSLKSISEEGELLVAVELGTVGKTTGPGKDRGDRVGGGLLALLVLTVMASDSAVGGLSLDRLAVRAHEDRGHHTERAVALGNRVRLDITIIVLACPDVTTVCLEAVGNHVIDETVLVPDAGSLELGLVLVFIEFGKDVLEAAIIALEDGVLGAEVEGPLLKEGVLEAGTSKIVDGLVEVVHAKSNTTARVVEDLDVNRLAAISGSELQFKLAGTRDHQVSGTVLVTKGVTTDNNGLSPTGDKTGHVLADDGFTENSAAKNVANGSIGAEPHFLKTEFLHSGLIRSDGGALDANVVLLDGFSGLNSDLVISLVTVLDAEIEVLNIKINEGEDEFLFDELPDDAGHLVAIEVDDGTTVDLSPNHFLEVMPVLLSGTVDVL
eukprot:Colp12_sorted_trinity150504_noHs@29020